MTCSLLAADAAITPPPYRSARITAPPANVLMTGGLFRRYARKATIVAPPIAIIVTRRRIALPPPTSLLINTSRSREKNRGSSARQDRISCYETRIVLSSTLQYRASPDGVHSPCYLPLHVFQNPNHSCRATAPCRLHAACTARELQLSGPNRRRKAG